MNSVKIIVKNGEGREVNPFQMSNANPMAGMNTFESYHQFEDNVQPHPAPGIKDGTHMARLQWQEKFAGMWHTLNSIEERSPVGTWRQAWVLSPDGEGEKEDLKNHFYLATEVGTIHVNMNPDADPEVFEAFKRMAEIAFKKK